MQHLQRVDCTNNSILPTYVAWSHHRILLRTYVAWSDRISNTVDHGTGARSYVHRGLTCRHVVDSDIAEPIVERNEPNANHSKGARAALKVPRTLGRRLGEFRRSFPFPGFWRPINKAFAFPSTCSLCFCMCCGRFLVFPPPPSPRFLHCEIKLTLELLVPFFSWQCRAEEGGSDRIAPLARGMAGGERWTSV